jgi:hypothetical protein
MTSRRIVDTCSDRIVVEQTRLTWLVVGCTSRTLKEVVASRTPLEDAVQRLIAVGYAVKTSTFADADDCGHRDRTFGHTVGRSIDDAFSACAGHRDARLNIVVPVEVRRTRLVVSDSLAALNKILTSSAPLIVSILYSNAAFDTHQSGVYAASFRIFSFSNRRNDQQRQNSQHTSSTKDSHCIECLQSEESFDFD